MKAMIAALCLIVAQTQVSTVVSQRQRLLCFPSIGATGTCEGNNLGIVNSAGDCCLPPPTGLGGEGYVLATSMDCSSCMSFDGNVGGDPHFSVGLPDNQTLCYTVQGERGSVFNLISNKNFHMNALFVPNSGKRNATWIGALGVVIGNSLQLSNVTKITINATSKSIHVEDGITLAAKNIHQLHLKNGELLSSISNIQKHNGNPRVKVILEDVGLQFTVRFTLKHLEIFWQSMGGHRKDSHGLIGQFLRSGVRIDHVQKMLIFPDKNPVPVKQLPVWGFMKHEFHEMADGKRCWATIKHGEQGEGLIDGTYVNYQVEDILSTDFQFKPNKH